MENVWKEEPQKVKPRMLEYLRATGLPRHYAELSRWSALLERLALSPSPLVARVTNGATRALDSLELARRRARAVGSRTRARREAAAEASMRKAGEGRLKAGLQGGESDSRTRPATHSRLTCCHCSFESR